MKVLYYIASVVFVISAFAFLISVCAVISSAWGKRCTQKGEATLLGVRETHGKEYDWWFEIAYTIDGVERRGSVNQVNTDGVTIKTPVGTRLPIWYDPKDPDRIIIAEDPVNRKKRELLEAHPEALFPLDARFLRGGCLCPSPHGGTGQFAPEHDHHRSVQPGVFGAGG